MQIGLKWVLFGVCALIALVVLLKVAKKGIKIDVLLAMIAVFLVGTKIIDLNTLSPEIQSKVDAVVDVVGDSMIKTSGNAVMVKVGNEWYDVSKIGIIGDLATEDIVLEYEDKEIYVGHTGFVNVLRVLESVGLIQTD